MESVTKLLTINIWYFFVLKQNLKFLFSLTSKAKKNKPPDLAAHSTANFRCKKSPQIDFKIMKSETQAAQIAC